MDFTRWFATRPGRAATPQSEPVPASAQVPNSAGGYAWPVDPWARLDRFLILGSEGGSYYVGERELTRENAISVARRIAEDGPRVVRRAVEMSVSGRAPRNDPALFVLAMAAGLGDDTTRRAALDALPEVARTGTHFFHWLRYVTAFRGWGRGVRRAVAEWYVRMPADRLAYQVLKYPSRDGWAHRDAIRLAHPVPPSASHELLFRLAIRGWDAADEIGPEIEPRVAELLSSVRALDAAKPAEAARRIAEARLVREMVPGELLRRPEVWEALLESLPLSALVRNLGVMSSVGLLTPMSDAAAEVTRRLSDADALRAARIHPLGILAALRTYAAGHGMRGKNVWEPVPAVVDALDAAFYASFGNAPVSGRRLLLALDVSSSMIVGVHGMPHLSCRGASAAMALVTAATEPRHAFVAFTAGDRPYRHGWRTGLSPLAISPRQRLDDVLREVSGLPFGGTDCALPMIEARERGWEVDVFVVYTDSETWAGAVHPAEALRDYRRASGIPARLVVVAMASNGFSIADPDDAGMLDVVGFDAATPAIVADFAGGAA